MDIVLTSVEELLMQCLWESGKDLTVNEMCERLKTEYQTEYTCNAVSTFLMQLLKKKAVSRYKKRHSHQYHPELDLENYRIERLKHFRKQWYKNADGNLIAAVTEIADVNEETREQIKALLEKYND